MKYLLTAIAMVVGLSGSVVQAEEITDFQSHLEVRPDATVFVTETITYDFGSEERHGIFRILTTNHPQAATSLLKTRRLAIVVRDVQSDGKTVPFSVAETASAVTVKIGDAAVVLSGVHTYVITYVLTGALSYGSDGTELYYNVTGNDWQVPLDDVSVTVSDPTGTLLSVATSCYVGVAGATDVCTKGVSSATSSQFSATALAPGAGLTVGQSFQAEVLPVVRIEKWRLTLFFIPISALWLWGLLVWAIRYHRQFKTKRPVVAQYEPYPGVLPLYTGVLFDNRLDPRDVTAGIIYLAEQGYIAIKRTEKKLVFVFTTHDYELTLIRDPALVHVPLLQTLLGYLFSGQTTVGTVMQVSDLAKRKRENTKYLEALKTEVEALLVTDGFLLAQKVPTYIWRACMIMGSVLVLSLFFVSFILILMVVVLSGIVVGLASFHRRSVRGYEARNHLAGFKLFLGVTETERYRFSDAPAKNPTVFMQYLPYAIAFGVEQEWSKAFADITIPQPDWFDGGTLNAFSASAFSTDIAAFSQAVQAGTASGSTGSSGGGSSGGGGGGGGGGSW